ncbi:MAG: virulence-associated E family protein [Eubacteriales bacterium]|nr:virulence-associated E family protein [Eubacteriales bacterium]
MQNEKITIAVGSSRREMRWRNRELLWPELVWKLSQPTRTPETEQEYKSLAKAQRDEIKDVGGFVGGNLRSGRRKAESVVSRQLLTLDLDAIPEGADPWGTVEVALACAACVYSTHSHTADAPRLRIVIPLSRPVTPEEYAALSRLIASDIGIDMCDDTTYEPHRLMYWPSCPADGPYVFHQSDGLWLDPDEQLARYANWRDYTQWPQSSRRQDTFRRAAKKQGNPEEKPGAVGAFCRVYPIEEAIDVFLAGVYVSCGDRYTYLGSEGAGGVVIYEGLWAYSYHGSDPASGRLCNAFDLVRIHKFGELDNDCVADTPIHKRPSYAAMTDFAIGDGRVRENLMAGKYAAAIAAFGEDDDPASDNTQWLQQLKLTQKGAVCPTIDNVVLILQNDPNLRGKYAFDDFRERPIVRGDLPWKARRDRLTDTWQDTDDAGLWRYIEKTYEVDGIAKIRAAVDTALDTAHFHPVRDYLASLLWDGTPRLDTLLIDMLGAEDCAYTRAVTRKACIGAVARVMEPGCKHDHMLVLVGPQGCGKSTFLARLGGQWFSDSLYTVSGKDAYEQVQGFWILEMSEMAAARKAELEQIKQFISKQTDSYRSAYARRTQDHPRQCAFFGTTNDNDFMHDATGGRRFWPVVVQFTEVNLMEALCPEVVAQIWGEALARYHAGEPWYLDRELEDEARLRQDAHTEVNEKQGLIEEFLERLLPKDWNSWSLENRMAYWFDDRFGESSRTEGTIPRTTVCVLEVWLELFKGDAKTLTPTVAREIKSCLRRVRGWQYQSCVRCGALYGRQRGFIRV